LDEKDQKHYLSPASLEFAEVAKRGGKREKIAAGSRSLPRSGGLLVPPSRREAKTTLFYSARHKGKAESKVFPDPGSLRDQGTIFSLFSLRVLE